jgi:Mg2+ and Co2+ transporter CorA
MAQLDISDVGIRLILSGLEDKNTVLLRKTDNLRKMKDSIADDLYDSINRRYQEDLSLIDETIGIIESQF